jgi:hypothetical protein
MRLTSNQKVSADANLFVRQKNSGGIRVLRCDHATEHTNINPQYWTLRVALERLAVFLRPRLPNAVDARGVAVTNRFFHGDELGFALQVRAARYVVDLVVVIQRDCDRADNLGPFWAARRTLVVVRRHYQLPGGEQRESEWQGRGGGQSPGQKGAPRTFRLFSQSLMQALVETSRRSQHAVITVKSNYIAHAVEERRAMTALSKMLIEGRSLDGDEILIDII